MFTDFKGFTRFAETLEPRTLVNDLNQYFSAFDEIIDHHGLEKLKTIGDAYMCAGGLPEENQTHAVDVCRAALEIQEFMHRVMVPGLDLISGFQLVRDLRGQDIEQ